MRGRGRAHREWCSVGERGNGERLWVSARAWCLSEKTRVFRLWGLWRKKKTLNVLDRDVRSRSCGSTNASTSSRRHSLKMRTSRLCLACLCLAGVAVPTDVPREQPAPPAPAPLFLPAWHFFQGATALEATGQLRDASRAIAAARRLEPVPCPLAAPRWRRCAVPYCAVRHVQWWPAPELTARGLGKPGKPRVQARRGEDMEKYAARGRAGAAAHAHAQGWPQTPPQLAPAGPVPTATRWSDAGERGQMGGMAEHATVGWMRGDDPYSVAQSLAEQLSLKEEWEQPLYQLVVNHELALNLSLPPVSQRASICTHTHTHTHTHSHTRTHTHTYHATACAVCIILLCLHSVHACMHVCMHTCIHAYMHTCIHACMYVCMYACMHTCIHAYIHTYMHTYIDTYIILPTLSASLLSIQ